MAGTCAKLRAWSLQAARGPGEEDVAAEFSVWSRGWGVLDSAAGEHRLGFYPKGNEKCQKTHAQTLLILKDQYMQE